MGLVDRAVRRIAPRLALKREVARLRLRQVEQARQSYDGARTDHRTDGWRPAGSSANDEVRGGAHRLRIVARDLCRNNAYARRAKRGIVNNAIAHGISPNAVGGKGTKRAVAALEKALKAHCDTTAIDVGGQLTLYGIQKLVLGTVVEAGEALVVRHRRRASAGLALPFQLRVLEPEYLDERKDGPIDGGGYMIAGIQFDGRGRRTGYWLYETHPGEQWRTPRSHFYPAADVAHVYDIERPGQARGVSWFASVILRLADLGSFADAQLVRQRVAACFVGFEEEPWDDDGPSPEDAGIRARDPEDGPGYDIEGLEPGIIQRVRKGRKMTFSAPPQVGDYEQAVRAFLREIAAGLSITYEVLTGDYSQQNFASGRMAWLEFWRSVVDWQENMIRPMLLERIGEWIMEAAAIKLGTPATVALTWTPPRREMINPREEIQAARDAIRSGLSSRKNEAAKLGHDIDDLDQENADDAERADGLGLRFDSDGRHPVNGQGAGSDATKDEADDDGGDAGGRDRAPKRKDDDGK